MEEQKGAANPEIGEGMFRVISGQDRMEAAKILGFTHIPAVIAIDWDDDMQKVQAVRFNAIRKKFDPVKFAGLFAQLTSKYSSDALKAMMMFTDGSELDKLLASVKKNLPQEMAEEVEKRQDKSRQ